MSLAPSIQIEPVPLHDDGRGGLRVGQTRVHLEFVVEAFEQGSSPEQIVEMYSTLELADVYAVISYYLRHRDEIVAYRQRRELEADEVEKKIRERQGPISAALVARLQSTKAKLQAERATPNPADAETRD